MKRKPVRVLTVMAMALFMAATLVVAAFPVTARAAQDTVSYTRYSWNESTKTLSTTTEETSNYTVVTKDLIKESSDGTGKGLMSGTFVVNSDTTIEDHVYIRKGCTVNLIVLDGVTLTCKKGIGCGYDKDKAYATLNIFGTGTIVSTGYDYAAGIGGKDNEASGNISIHGTTVKATGGFGGAGIGGGDGGKDPDGTTSIKIYAGNITATGGKYGAGIGGGDEQPGAHTYIYGGTITASSKEQGAGIGGGDEEGTLGVYIYGGKVTATGGRHGAGIGAGEGGGNLRKAEDGGGINILGGAVTAEGGEGGAGIGGGWFENMSGTIVIAGSPESVTVKSGRAAAGIGAGKGLNDSSINCKGDMKGTITIDTSSDCLIRIEAVTFGGAGIGAGYTGNMDGKVYIQNGNIEVHAVVGGAGIGGGAETDNTGAGGEGGDVYIGGGTLKIICTDKYSDAQAIGYGWQMLTLGTDPSGSVYITPDKNQTGKFMRVAYSEDNGKTYKTANAGDRSKKCHQDEIILLVTECGHKDYNGATGLSYTINKDGTHTEKCKYCGYEVKKAHMGSDCVCGYSSPNVVVTLSSLDGIATFTVARGNSFTLPYSTGEILSGNAFPSPYFEVKGWTMTGDTSGTIYEAGSDVTVNADTEFSVLTESVYIIECAETENGRISPDLSEAKAGDPVRIKVLPNAGYSVGSVSYTYITDFDYASSSYIYAESTEIPAADGMYQLTMPQLPIPANGIVVSAEFTKDAEQPIFIQTTSDGSVDADTEKAAEGTLVTLTVTPDEGFFVKKISCTAANDAEVELTKVSDTCYTFTMPADSVAVGTEFDEPPAWKTLQAEIDDISGGTITLAKNCVADADDTALVIPAGKTITIDLNGFSIDRNLFDPAENGSAIVNNGTLTITDSSQEKTGTITGGFSAQAGGAVLNNGTLTVDGGTFTGNCAKEGGAIANISGASLTVNDGTITGNTTHTWGGAGILNQGTATVNGGTISENAITATGMNGAGIWTNNSLTITGGTIAGNTSRTGNGGGIYYSGGTLRLSGSPVITGNTALGEDNDLFINGNYALSITGELAADAKIGIRERTLSADAFTAGLAGNGTAANFVSNHSGKAVGLNADGEAYLLETVTVAFVPNDGNAAGTMDVVNVTVGDEYVLPNCGYTVSGRVFTGWKVGETGELKQPGDTITVTEDTTVAAVWKDEPKEYFLEEDYDYHNGRLTIEPSSRWILEGTTVTVTAEPYSGGLTTSMTAMMDDDFDHYREYVFDVPGVSHPDPNTMVFVMPSANVKVSAAFTDYTQYGYSRVFCCDMVGGTVESDHDVAQYGDEVTLTIRPDNGYSYVPGSLEIVEVDRYTGDETPLYEDYITEVTADSVYAFEMYTSNTIYIRALFTEEEVTEQYAVLVEEEIENGTLTADLARASEGWTVTVTAEPDAWRNYELAALTVTDTDGRQIPVTSIGHNRHTFTMPAGDVRVSAEFAVPVYAVTVRNPDGAATNCDITADAEAETGSRVTVVLTIMPERKLTGLMVVGDSTGTDYSAGITLDSHREGSSLYFYKFTMPHEPVTITARFDAETYLLQLDDAFAGTVKVSVNGDEPQSLPVTAVSDDIISITYTAPEFYTLRTLRYRCVVNGTERTISLGAAQQEDGSYTASFTMRGSDTTLLEELEKPLVSYSNNSEEVIGEQRCTIVTEETTAWDTGWYATKKNVTIPERIEVTGNVHVILGRDARGYPYELTAVKGIHVASGASLTIWSEGWAWGPGIIRITEPDDGYAGIGGNVGENGGSVTINGGELIVTAGSGAEAIGKGAGASDSGTLILAAGIAVEAGEDAGSSEDALTADRLAACRSPYANTWCCLHGWFGSAMEYTYTETKHQGTCMYCGYAEEEEEHTYFSSDHYCMFCHYNEVVVTYDPNGGWLYLSTESLGKGDTLILPDAPYYPVEGYVFEGWQIGTGSKLYPAGSEYVVKQDVTAKAIWKTDPWKELEVLVNEAPEGSTVVLKRDYTASVDSSPLYFSAKNITLDLNGHTINRNLNSYKSDGFAIQNRDDSMLTIRDTTGKGTIRGAYNKDDGGAIINEGTLSIIGVTFTQNRTTDYGAAIYNDEGDLTLTDVIMTNNYASRGGAVYMDDGTLTVQGGLFRENEASRSGGALYIGEGTSAVIDGDAEFSMNKAKSDSESTQGGAILNAGTLTVNSGTFTQNIAIEGGVIYNIELYYDASATINGGVFKNNGASNGSVIYNLGGEVTVTGGEMTANLAYGDGTDTTGCGTIYNTSYDYEDGILTVSGGSIHDNTASFLGAGVYMDSGIFNIEGSPRIYDNAFYDWEGGNSVFLNDDTVMTVIGDLSQDALICADTNKQDVPVAITSGLKGHGGPEVFVSDSVNRFVLTNGYGEAVLGVPCIVSFDPGDGSGVLFPVIVAEAYPLPECDFDVPDGMQFKEWSVVIGDGEAIQAQPGDEIMVTADTTVTAVWEPLPSDPTFRTQSIILSGEIGVNFFVNLPEAAGLEYGDSYMTFSISGKGDVTARADYDPAFTNTTGEAYGFTCYINAIQMADTITATYHYQKNGAWKTIEKQYAVRDYFAGFDSYVDQGYITDSATIELVHALADYGHYVQPFLSTVRGWRLGSDYAEQGTFYATYSSDEIQAAKNDTASRALAVDNGTDGDIEEVTHSLTLDSETAINVFFQPASGYRGTLTASVDGETVRCTQDDQGRWFVRIENVSAHELSSDRTVTVTTDNGTATVTVSALSYVNSALNHYEDDAEAQNAAMAIYRYAKAADAYKAAYPDD